MTRDLFGVRETEPTKCNRPSRRGGEIAECLRRNGVRIGLEQDSGSVYVLIPVGGRWEMRLLRSESFRAWLRSKVHRATGVVLRLTTLFSVISALEAHALGARDRRCA